MAVEPTDLPTDIDATFPNRGTQGDALHQQHHDIIHDAINQMTAEWDSLAGVPGPEGPPGADGADGAVGPEGPPGPAGLSVGMFHYRAEAVNTSGNPTDGHLLWDAATQINAANLHVSHEDQDGNDVDNLFTLITVGDTLLIQDRDLHTNNQIWTVTGTPTLVVEAHNYWVIPVDLVSSSGTGTTDFADNHQLLFVIAHQPTPLQNPTFIFDSMIDEYWQTVPANSAALIPFTTPEGDTLVTVPDGWFLRDDVSGWEGDPVLLVPLGTYAVTWYWVDDGNIGRSWNNWAELYCINTLGNYAVMNTEKVRDNGSFGSGSITVKFSEWTGNPDPGYGMLWFTIRNMDVSNAHDILHSITVTRLDA